jgi:hypothetical protein
VLDQEHVNAGRVRADLATGERGSLPGRGDDHRPPALRGQGGDRGFQHGRLPSTGRADDDHGPVGPGDHACCSHLGRIQLHRRVAVRQHCRHGRTHPRLCQLGRQPVQVLTGPPRAVRDEDFRARGNGLRVGVGQVRHVLVGGGDHLLLHHSERFSCEGWEDGEETISGGGTDIPRRHPATVPQRPLIRDPHGDLRGLGHLFP